jgi:hypothetical protein
MVVYTYNHTYSGGGGRKIKNLRSARAKLARPISKTKQNKNTNKKAGSVAQMV